MLKVPKDSGSAWIQDLPPSLTAMCLPTAQYRCVWILTAKATLNKYVQVVPLPKSTSDLPTGTPCSTAEWGLIDELQTTEKLYETNITIYSHKKCMMIYSNLDDGMICAGSDHQLRDTSQGDSGGPMVCGGVVHGIVSFGYDFPPGVYARVAHYLPWIKEVMGPDL
ncbi:mast cell protease 1-like [Hemicordylus capensis]|uniref:mast cell protease 1-like n=1 Tax=Hemicordylus capensis TaxID=884348 RepID=UPI00230278B9|nr:mast cell protease 1-like [Hemicordylus capensis]